MRMIDENDHDRIMGFHGYVHICSMIMENHGKFIFLVDQNCHSPLLDKPWTCCVENIARCDNVTYAPHLHVLAEILHCFLVLTLGASGKGSQHGVPYDPSMDYLPIIIWVIFWLLTSSTMENIVVLPVDIWGDMGGKCGQPNSMR